MITHGLPLTSIENIRDMGGYQNVEGQTLRPKKIIRSASIHELSEQDQIFLQDYGLKTIIDLRSRTERFAQPDQAIKGVTNLFVPVLPEKAQYSASPVALIQGLMKGKDPKQQLELVYRSFVTETTAHTAYRKLFVTALSNVGETDSLLFHCTIGKDRTGFGAALFLGALGMSDRLILGDYLATNSFLVNKTRQLETYVATTGMKMPPGFREMMQAKEQYLAASYGEIGKRYGSLFGFLREGLGLSQHDLQELRALYLK